MLAGIVVVAMTVLKIVVPLECQRVHIWCTARKNNLGRNCFAGGYVPHWPRIRASIDQKIWGPSRLAELTRSSGSDGIARCECLNLGLGLRNWIA